MVRAMPRKFFSSAFLITGTIRPQSKATAIPMLHSLCRTNVRAIHGRVHRGKGAQGLDGGAHEERHEGELGAAGLRTWPSSWRAGRRSGDVRFVHGVNVRGDALREHHVLGDALPHDGHGLDFVMAEVHFFARHGIFEDRGSARATCGWRNSRGTGRRRCRSRSCAGRSRRSGRAAALHGLRMSLLLTRPPAPVPGTWESRYCSRARFCGLAESCELFRRLEAACGVACAGAEGAGARISQREPLRRAWRLRAFAGAAAGAELEAPSVGFDCGDHRLNRHGLAFGP
jgi:hypothetical protein